MLDALDNLVRLHGRPRITLGEIKTRSQVVFLTWVGLMVYISQVLPGRTNSALIALVGWCAWLALDKKDALPLLSRFRGLIDGGIALIVYAFIVPYVPIALLASGAIRFGTTAWDVTAGAWLWLVVLSVAEYAKFFSGLRVSRVVALFLLLTGLMIFLSAHGLRSVPPGVPAYLWFGIWLVIDAAGAAVLLIVVLAVDTVTDLLTEPPFLSETGL